MRVVERSGHTDKSTYRRRDIPILIRIGIDISRHYHISSYIYTRCYIPTIRHIDLVYGTGAGIELERVRPRKFESGGFCTGVQKNPRTGETDIDTRLEFRTL